LIAVVRRGILSVVILSLPLSPEMMPAKCSYCARPLRGFGVKCRACRRYVLRWHHILLLTIVGFVVVAFVLNLFFSFF
jgi:hypothetical protein